MTPISPISIEDLENVSGSVPAVKLTIGQFTLTLTTPDAISLFHALKKWADG